VSKPRPGRHRAPDQPSTASSLSSALTRSTRPAVKASALVAVTGGMVASVAVPAVADPASGQQQPQGSQHQAVDAGAKFDAPTVAAPATASATVVAPDFGNVGFTREKPDLASVVPAAAYDAPEPEPVVADRTADVASRDTVREPATDPAPAPAADPAPAPAPEPEPASAAPAPTGGILGIAAQYVGTPYVYGGSSPSGFDCSGYTQYVFGQAGISLPRTAAAQQAASTPVSSPQPGDLVFFGSPAYHVGIYAGGGMMYDSPHPGTVVQKRPIWSSAHSFGRP
jgi:cell wall-associated NlpC family hydrolase